MSHRLLADTRFHRALSEIDALLAAEAREAGCGVCGGKLHVADYPRKPRGQPELLDPAWSRRHSFCCAAEDCRRRATPASVRFLDRRVYTGVVVLLASVLAQGLSGRRLRRLREELVLERRTLERWRRWWREEMPRGDFWAELRGRLIPAIEERLLPAVLLERMRAGDEAERLQLLLRLIAPLGHSALMRRRFARVA